MEDEICRVCSCPVTNQSCGLFECPSMDDWLLGGAEWQSIIIEVEFE